MKFSAIIAAFATTALAGPLYPNTTYHARSLNTTASTAGTNLCDNVIKCIESLATIVETCGAAALAGGANVTLDAQCLEDAVQSISTVPAACSNCLTL